MVCFSAHFLKHGSSKRGKGWTFLIFYRIHMGALKGTVACVGRSLDMSGVVPKLDMHEIILLVCPSSNIEFTSVTDTFRGNSRRALRNESNEEVHVIDESVVVGAGQVFGLMFVCSGGVVVHVDDAILHTSDVSQVLWQVLGFEGVFSILWRWKEYCLKGCDVQYIFKE